MNLLNYTKKLYDRINAFDKAAQNPFLDKGAKNPFYKPQNVTIVWVENKNDKCN